MVQDLLNGWSMSENHLKILWDILLRLLDLFFDHLLWSLNDNSPDAVLNAVTSASICGYQLRCSCNRTPRYLTVVYVFILFPLILKFQCLVIVFTLGLNSKISVLLVLKLILFDLNQWIRSAKSWFIRFSICFRDLCISNRLVSSAKWCVLLLLMDTFTSFMKIMNESSPNTESNE